MNSKRIVVTLTKKQVQFIDESIGLWGRNRSEVIRTMLIWVLHDSNVLYAKDKNEVK